MRQAKRERPERGARRIAIQITGWVGTALFPLLCLLIMEYCNYKALLTKGRVWERLWMQLTKYGPHVLFAVLVVYGLAAVLLLLCRRAWLAEGILGVLSLLFGFINYLKIKLNSAPFVPADVALAGTPKELVSYISVPMPRLFWIAAVLVVVWTVLLAVWRIRLPGRWYVTAPAALVLLAAVLGLFWNSDRAERILNRFQMSLFDNALQSSNYTANGFVSGFSVNLIGMHVTAPEGYSKDAVTAILEGYEATDSTREDFDVILVLSESFFDPRTLPGVTFSENPLPNYDEILADENCYSGSIVTTAHGGGTVNSEVRILTGLDLDGLLPPGGVPYNYVKDQVPGYMSNYKSGGYQTIGLHLYNLNFYNRKKAYPLIGIDSFYGERAVEDAGVDLWYTRAYASDDSTEKAIEHYMDEAAAGSGAPTFLFAITIENHQPYKENEDNTVTVEANGLHPHILQALTTYTQGVKDADQMLGALRDYIDGRDRPTVLVWFGDHLPTLGETYTPYYALGYYDDSGSQASQLAMFSTPFLVYSNRTLDRGLFTSKSDNLMSEIYLMECVAASTGYAQTPYMRYLADCYETLPVYNEKLGMDGSLTEEQTEIVEAWRLLAYDRLLGKRYSGGP